MDEQRRNQIEAQLRDKITQLTNELTSVAETELQKTRERNGRVEKLTADFNATQLAIRAYGLNINRVRKVTSDISGLTSQYQNLGAVVGIAPNLYPATGPGIATGYCNEERAANTANKQSTAGKKEVPTVAKQGTPIRADSPAVNRSETIKQVKGKPIQQCVIKASIRPASVTDTNLVAAKEGSNRQAVGSTSKIIEGGKMAGEGGSSSSNIGRNRDGKTEAETKSDAFIESEMQAKAKTVAEPSGIDLDLVDVFMAKQENMVKTRKDILKNFGLLSDGSRTGGGCVPVPKNPEPAWQPKATTPKEAAREIGERLATNLKLKLMAEQEKAKKGTDDRERNLVAATEIETETVKTDAVDDTVINTISRIVDETLKAKSETLTTEKNDDVNLMEEVKQESATEESMSIEGITVSEETISNAVNAATNHQASAPVSASVPVTDCSKKEQNKGKTLEQLMMANLESLHDSSFFEGDKWKSCMQLADVKKTIKKQKKENTIWITDVHNWEPYGVVKKQPILTTEAAGSQPEDGKCAAAGSQPEDGKCADNQEIVEESFYTTGSFEVIKDWNPDQDITHEDD